MKTNHSTVAMILCLCFLPYCSHADVAGKRASIRDEPGYIYIQPVLQELVNQEAKDKINHFYIAKYIKGHPNTYMVWPEGRALWIFPIGTKIEHYRSVLLPPGSKRRIDLDTGVVPTVEEVGSSTYLVDQPWVNAIVFDAVINGDLLVIKKVEKK